MKGSKTSHNHLRDKHFSISEDETICRSWLNISHSLRGTKEMQTPFWDRVMHEFKIIHGNESNRSIISLAGRWRTIRSKVNNFSEYLAQVESNHKSGTVEADRIIEAKRMYRKIHKRQFRLEHCWNILRGNSKWEELSATLTTRRQGKKASVSTHLSPSTLTNSILSTSDSVPSTPYMPSSMDTEQLLDSDIDFELLLDSSINLEHFLSVDKSETRAGKKDANVVRMEDSQDSRSPGSRSKCFSIAEDETICRSWLNVSHPLYGIEIQTPFWDRLLIEFKNIHGEGKKRYAGSLKSRWRKIQKEVKKFCEYLTQVQSKHQSGISEADKIVEAKYMYCEIHKKQFLFEHCWNILHGNRKWEQFTKTTRQQCKKAYTSSHLSSSSSIDLVSSTTAPSTPKMLDSLDSSIDLEQLIDFSIDLEQLLDFETLLIPDMDHEESLSEEKSESLPRRKDDNLVIMEDSQASCTPNLHNASFSIYEDETICRSWLNASHSLGSTKQMQTPFWDLILHEFKNVHGDESNRTAISLKYRWRTIRSEVNKFCEYLAQVQYMLKHQISTTETTTTIEAEAKHKYHEIHKKQFPFDHCWNIFRGNRKWEELTTNTRKHKKVPISATSSPCTLMDMASSTWAPSTPNMQVSLDSDIDLVEVLDSNRDLEQLQSRQKLGRLPERKDANFVKMEDSQASSTLRGKTFSTLEEETLCRSWLNVTQEPLSGTILQTSFWDRVWLDFNNIQSNQSNRAPDSLKNRWYLIRNEVNKFCECLEHVESKHQSEIVESNKIIEAKQMYNEVHKKQFLFEHCWNILRGNSMWEELSTRITIRKQYKKTPSSTHLSPSSLPNLVPSTLALSTQHMAISLHSNIDLEQFLDSIDPDQFPESNIDQEKLLDYVIDLEQLLQTEQSESLIGSGDANIVIPEDSQASCTRRLRRTSFSIHEDEVICRCWLHIHPLCATKQTQAPFWERILHEYKTILGDENNTTTYSLSSRWRRIRIEVSKFCEYLKEVESKHQNHTAEADKIIEAKHMYREVHKKQFLFEHCWNVLRGNNKWEELTTTTRKQCNKSPGSTNMAPTTLAPLAPHTSISLQSDVDLEKLLSEKGSKRRVVRKDDEESLTKKRSYKRTMETKSSQINKINKSISSTQLETVRMLHEGNSSHDATCIKEPICILDRKEQVLRTKVVPLVKVQWNPHDENRTSWERETNMREKYPYLFNH